MERDRELPEVYAHALRLADDGCSTQEIARRVGVEPEAVPPLLRIARAKRERVTRRGEIG